MTGKPGQGAKDKCFRGHPLVGPDARVRIVTRKDGRTYKACLECKGIRRRTDNLLHKYGYAEEEAVD